MLSVPVAALCLLLVPTPKVGPTTTPPTKKVGAPTPVSGGTEAEPTDEAETRVPSPLKGRVRVVAEDLGKDAALNAAERKQLVQIVMAMHRDDEDDAVERLRRLAKAHAKRRDTLDADALLAEVLLSYALRHPKLRESARKAAFYGRLRFDAQTHAAAVRKALDDAGQAKTVKIPVVELRTQFVPGRAPVVRRGTKTLSRAQWADYLTSLDAQLEAAEDTGQMMQVDFQQALAAQAQTIQTVSSIMKRMHETTRSIIDNMK